MLTVGELEDLSLRLAGHLQTKFALEKGDSVAFTPINSATSVVTIFALMRLGIATLIMAPTDPLARRSELCAKVGIRLQFHDPNVSSEFRPESNPIPDIRSLDRLYAKLPEISSWSDVFYIGTSGSTAASKVVRQMHINAASNASDITKHHGLGSGQRFLGCLPIHHVNGLHFTIFATLVSGMEAILLTEFQPLSFASILEKYSPRIASVAPSLLEALVAVWRRPSPIVGLDYFVSAAAPLRPSTAKAVFEKMGARIVQSYGLTETTNFSCVMPVDLSDQEYINLMIKSEIPPVGVPVSNEVSILYPNGDKAPDGEIGEVCMRGPNIMAGYYGNDDENQAAFMGDWFHSGDLGYQFTSDFRGPLTVLTGRIKNIAKIRGETVSLDEIDRALMSIPGVTDGACITLNHLFDGEEIIALVVLEKDLCDDEIMGALKQILPVKAIPRRVLRCETLPRTKTGKIIRPELREKVLRKDQ